MRETLFILFFIWLFVSVGSLILGPLVGFDKNKTKTEIKEFFQKNPKSITYEICRRLVFLIAYLGYLLPATYPLLGIFGSFIFLITFTLLKN